MSIIELEALTRLILVAIIDGKSVDQYCTELKSTNLLPDDINLSFNHDVLWKIGLFLQLQTGSISVRKEVNNRIEEVVECTTIHQIFMDELNNEHLHSKGDAHCIYHRESLFSHLVLAMLIALDQTRSADPQVQFLAGLTALIHDIGKKASMSACKHRKITRFPFHGEMGSMILQGLYNPETFDNFLTQEEWETICRTVSVHMCGYHDTFCADKWTLAKWNQLRLESAGVKQLLVSLSVADTYAAIPDITIERIAYDQFLESRKTFEEIISKVYDHGAFKAVYRSHGTLFSILGISGSGKSTMIKQLIAFLQSVGIEKKKILVVERDMFMVRTVARYMNWPVPTTRPVGEEYDKYFREYVQRKKEGLAVKVNEHMKKVIVEQLKAGRIVIVDTVATLFGDSVHPGGKGLGNDNDLLANCLKISIYVNRLAPLHEHDAQKNGHKLVDQLKLMGSVSITNRFPQGIRPDQLKCLESLMTSGNMEHDIRDWTKRTRPHLAFTVSWSQSMTLGLPTMNHILSQIAPNFVTETTVLNVTCNMTIKEVMEYHWNSAELQSDNKIEKISNWFYERGFICRTLMKQTPYFGKYFIISYLDGFCYEWSERWCRECRGVVVYMDDQGVCHVISRKLQRGAEVLTAAHLKKKISETQELGGKREHRFDTHQTETIKLVRDGGKLQGWLTSKVDGSLLAVNLYRWGTPLCEQIWKMINDHADEFTKNVALASVGSRFLVVLSTNNTFFHASIMHAYNTTALSVGLNIYTEQEIRVLAATNEPHEIITSVMPELLKRLDAFYCELPSNNQTDAMTLSFESVCADRISAWGDKHIELAVSYKTSGFFFLGVTYGLDTSSGFYLPHFTIPQSVAAANFSEPMWWSVDDGNQVGEMLHSLDAILIGEMTEESFLEQFPADGGSPNRWDYEGFVFFRFNDDKTREPYDYSKVKTPTYYICHIPKESAFDALSRLPANTQERFPLAQEVGNFFNGLYNNLLAACSSFERNLKEAEQDANHPIVQQLPDGPRRGYDKQTNSVTKMRILCATSDELIFHQYFSPHIIDLPQEAGKTIQKLIMELQLWEAGWEKRLEETVQTRSMTVRKIFVDIRTRPIKNSQE
jgi:hypothetical protein